MTQTLTVEVDVALSRPPVSDARIWVEVAVGPDGWVAAAETACQMAACHPAVTMPVGYRIIDWTD